MVLFVISSCLSQLKWNYYEAKAPLYHMQALDKASRGPWGACEVLWMITPGIATAGALLMILSVAVDPFTQQILAFPSRDMECFNETAIVQRAQENSPAWSLPGLQGMNFGALWGTT